MEKITILCLISIMSINTKIIFNKYEINKEYIRAKSKKRKLIK